ncbi:MAG: hypothetical protein IT345_10690 [Trueperaceae bacterium]|nr:hypothetical protein [Trueperaceae bacterium]
MAKFTAGVDLDLAWTPQPGMSVKGAAGATHRIPDALVSEFIEQVVPNIPGGVTWVTQDELTSIVSLPIAQADVTGLTAALDGKYATTGGTISGAVTVTGAISGGSITTPGLTATAAAFGGSPWYDAKAYGVTADGVTDDLTAMNAAVAAASATRGTVRLALGTTVLSGPLTMAPGVSIEGSGVSASILQFSATTGAGIVYPATTAAPETGWNTWFGLRDFGVLHSGSAAAIQLNTSINWYIENVRADGVSATGPGIEIVDSYFGRLSGVRSRSFTSGAAILYRSTGLTQPGQVEFADVVASTSSYGISISAASGVIDSLSFVNCVTTNNTDRSLSVVTTSGGIRNVRVQNLHIENDSTTNAATGIYQSGTDCRNLALDGLFLWGIKTPVNVTGTVNGLTIARLYGNSNSHATPGALLTIGASVTEFLLGTVVQTGYSAISDSSDATTRRKQFAGARPVVQQASSAYTITATAAQISGMSYTASPAYDETWTVLVTIDCNITSADPGLVTGQIVLDGATVGPSILFSAAGALMRATVGTTHVMAGITPSTSHTLEIHAKKANAGGTAVAQAANTRMTILRSTG